MEIWNSIVNTALLGTEKRNLKKEEFPAALHQIVEQASSKEEAFLSSAAAVFNLRQCGFVALQKETIDLPKAEAEVKPYASDLALSILKETTASGSVALLHFWLAHCRAAGLVVRPDAVPSLLDAAAKTKWLYRLCLECCGKRGEWISALNPLWKMLTPQSNEELWQTGTVAQRKEVLQRVRENDAAAARTMLQQVWPQESAAVKADLLETLQLNISNDDVEWLENLLTEKSTKVKDAALQLLNTIPSSSIVQRYWDVLKQSVQLETSKGLLGIGSKSKFIVNLIGVDKDLFTTGIQQISNTKGMDEDAFIVSQLMAAVPPSFWGKHFVLPTETIIQLFAKEKDGPLFLKSLHQAAIRFQNKEWVNAIINVDKNEFYPTSLGVLTQADAEKYALRFLSNDVAAETVIQYLYLFQHELSPAFAAAILPHLARLPYHYGLPFYLANVHRFPLSLIPVIERIEPVDGCHKQMWNNLGEHLRLLLILKQQINTVFNG